MSASLWTRRDFLRAAGFGATAIALGGYGPAAKSAASLGAAGRPNIVLILIDDLGAQALAGARDRVGLQLQRVGQARLAERAPRCA